MSSLFVTASGTEIGKTFVTETLLAQLRDQGHDCTAIKPVISGYDPNDVAGSDTGRLLAAQGLDMSIANVEASSPWRFAAPLSPDMAARREGREIDFDSLLAFCRERDGRGTLLIEGVGGVMVPLDERHTVLDWIRELGVPALLVGGSYLGSISHTLSAAYALVREGIELGGVVVDQSPDEPVPTAETANVIRRFVPGCPIVALPRKSAGDAPAAPDLTTLVARYLKRD